MGRLTPFLDDIVLAAVLLGVFALLLPALLPWALVGIVVYTAAKLYVFRSHFRPPAVGVEAMRDRVALAVSDLGPRGHVDLDGELWEAESTERVRKGERVRVEAVEGLVLRVVPLGVAGPVRELPRGSVLLEVARRLQQRSGDKR